MNHVLVFWLTAIRKAINGNILMLEWQREWFFLSVYMANGWCAGNTFGLQIDTWFYSVYEWKCNKKNGIAHNERDWRYTADTLSYLVILKFKHSSETVAWAGLTHYVMDRIIGCFKWWCNDMFIVWLLGKYSNIYCYCYYYVKLHRHFQLLN